MSRNGRKRSIRKNGEGWIGKAWKRIKGCSQAITWTMDWRLLGDTYVWRNNSLYYGQKRSWYDS